MSAITLSSRTGGGGGAPVENSPDNLPVSAGFRGEEDTASAEKRAIVDQIIKIMERLKLMTEFPSDNTKAMAATTAVIVDQVKRKVRVVMRPLASIVKCTMESISYTCIYLTADRDPTPAPEHSGGLRVPAAPLRAHACPQAARVCVAKPFCSQKV